MRNVNELFSKMKPDAQQRVSVRSEELLKEMALTDLQIAEPDGVADGEPKPPATADARRR